MTGIAKKSFIILLLLSVLTVNVSFARTITYKGKHRIQPYDEIGFIHIDSKGNESHYKNIPVLPNGYIALPAYGELPIQDLTLEEFEQKLDLKEGERVKLYISYHQRRHVFVIGAVKSPGSYSVKDMVSIYDAIATAGGFTKLANKHRVKVVRSSKDGIRTAFYIDFPREVFNAYDEGIGEEKFVVKEGDIVYVPESIYKNTGKVMLSVLNFATLGFISAVITTSLANRR